ncbi:MAG: NADP-dependent oxidoreductase [Sandaracinaceae bacterium]
MRAVRIHEYGGVETLRLEDIAPPDLGPHDLRIDVKAAGVNPVDYKLRSGAQRAVVPLSMPWTLGMDVSGVVSEVGARVSGFAVGDEVFASPHHKRMGGYADEVVVRADECAIKPAGLNHIEAAALPLTGLTAWDALVEACELQPGQKVLVQAGAGGVGTVAIQLAKHLGAEVYTTCSPRNAELVRELGADHVIDYRTQRFEEVAEGCDAVLESMGGEHVDRAIRAVRPGGRVASITQRLPELTEKHGPWMGVLVLAWTLVKRTVTARLSRGVRLKVVARKANGATLAKLAKLVEEGAIVPVVDRIFPLDEVQDAHRYIETGRARGKVVLRV